MKQFDTTVKEIGEYKFYIRPFPAFKAARISGQLASILGPLVGGLASVFARRGDAEQSVNALGDALAGLDGDKVEALMKTLLIQYENITYEDDGNKTAKLTEDSCNEIFCASLYDMYTLAYEVIQLNFSDFFAKIGSLYGQAPENTAET